ncbi:hypothetical protein AAKU67_004156 [Oxalobacteraceae bacterium GrIS 2.11]
MTIPITTASGLRPETVNSPSSFDHSHADAGVVSWAAILVGATAAAALSLILLMLGAGLGLSSISPWAHDGISKTSFGVSSIVWIAVTQILAAGMGGYLAGRLRTKWANAHVDEVYFRDTAHGFMAWAVATLATAALLTSAIGTTVSSVTHAGAAVAGGAGTVGFADGVATVESDAHKEMGKEANRRGSVGGSEGSPVGYYIDSLFRPDANATGATSEHVRVTDATSNANFSIEVARIFGNSVNQSVLPPADASYVGRLVAQRTGLSQLDAEKRVNDVFATMQAKKAEAENLAREAADKLRKATIYITLWLFVSLLAGAFSASLAATWGGRTRDA